MKFLIKFLYFSCVSVLIVVILEYAASLLIQKEMKNELPIFQSILTDNKNILTIKPDFHHLWMGNIQVRTNHDGYREDFNFSDQDLNVAFMGDSFCFGYGVNVENRYSNIVAKKLIDSGTYPKNTLASLCYNNGFQIEHYEYFLQKHPLLKPKHLVVNLYLGNDIDGDVNETLVTRDADGFINAMELPWRSTYGDLFRNVSDRYEWITWLKERSNIARVILYRINRSIFRQIVKNNRVPIPDSANSLAVEMGQLGEIGLRPFESLSHIKKMMTERGTMLHILVIPQNFIVGSDENPHLAHRIRDSMSEIREARGLIKSTLQQCAERNLECHDLSQILQADDYSPDDAHWSTKGNTVVAGYLEKILDIKSHGSP